MKLHYFCENMVKRWFFLSFLLSGLIIVLGLQEAAAQSGRSPELNMQYHRAETAWRMGGNLVEAKTRVDNVLREAPNDGEARKLRAKILLEKNRPLEALFDAQRAAAVMPDDAEALLLLSEASRLSGDTRRAIHALERSLDHLGEDADMHLRLSWNAMELGRLDYAESLGRVALSLDESNPVAYLHLARVFVKKERDRHAVQLLRRGLKKGVLTPASIRQDPDLSRLEEYEALRSVLFE